MATMRTLRAGIDQLLRKIATINRLAGAAGFAFCMLVAVTSLAARAAPPTATGLWQKVDDTGAPAAWFRIIECNGLYEGKIVKMFPTPEGRNPANWRCTKCEGVQKNAPVLGLTFITGMRQHGLTYEDGSILDPRDGSIYSARMQLSPDGSRLTVRGYLGIPLLGQNEVWNRLPDNSLPPGRFASCA